MRRVLWIIVPTLIFLVGASLWLRLKISPLCLSASHSTLHVGESAQLFVTRKTWLGHRPLAHPEKTHYATMFESIAVVEPDGKVTAVGTWGEREETAIVSATNGRLSDKVRISLLAEGPGPSLDFVVQAPSVEGMSTATCCSTPARLIEGERVILFFGSGVRDDPNAAQIVGYGEGINPATFLIDDEHGVIVAPTSIGRLNRFTVLAFALNGEAVGWKQFQLAHAASGDSR
jgi:hypothetical protein